MPLYIGFQSRSVTDHRLKGLPHSLWEIADEEEI
jgi:hypothetical protein